jgi:hypothetical protein
VNNEKYPREPLAALGLSVIALFLLAGATGAANHEWLLALSGFGAPVLAYFLFPPNDNRAGVRGYGTALIGGLVVVGESFLWFSAAGPLFAASVVAAAVAGLYVALYVVVRKLQA